MLSGFYTDNVTMAKAAMIVYAVYRSRDKRRGPSGVDMWGQIERFARASAKRSMTIGEFIASFKRRMACDTINPRWMQTGMYVRNDYGEIIVRGDQKHFMPEIMECDEDEQKEIVDTIYRETSRIILLVRGRLEDEKPMEADIVKTIEIETEEMGNE